MTPYYQDQLVTLYHGDCRDVLPLVAGSASVTITDPPYNVGLNYSGGDDRDDYAEWTSTWFGLCPRPLVVTPGVMNLRMWLQMEKPRWTCAWVKPNQCSASALNGFNTWEPILVYGKHRKPVGQDAWVMPIGTAQVKAGDHPCPKWYPFWSQLVLKFSLDDDLVLDPFCGSGTTLEAAKRLGRTAIGIELEERYCEITAERLSQGVLFTDEKAG